MEPQLLPGGMIRGSQPKAYRRAIAEFEALVSRLLAERRADGIGRGDLLSMLLTARDPETGEGMSDKQLRDEILTIFLAGHETTATALSWCWYLLAQHPEAEARLHDELDRVLGARMPNFSASTLAVSRLMMSSNLLPIIRDLHSFFFSADRGHAADSRRGVGALRRRLVVKVAELHRRGRPFLHHDLGTSRRRAAITWQRLCSRERCLPFFNYALA